MKKRDMPVRIRPSSGTDDDLEYWLSRPEEERISSVEFLREQMLAVTGQDTMPRLQRIITIRKR